MLPDNSVRRAIETKEGYRMLYDMRQGMGEDVFLQRIASRHLSSTRIWRSFGSKDGTLPASTSACAETLRRLSKEESPWKDIRQLLRRVE